MSKICLALTLSLVCLLTEAGEVQPSASPEIKPQALTSDCPTGVGEVVYDNEIGCVVCGGSPGGSIYRQNALCAHGKFVALNGCFSTPGPSSCPIPSGGVCIIFSSKFIRVGEKACVATGEERPGKYVYEYGECVSKGNYRQLKGNIDENDARCTTKINPH